MSNQSGITADQELLNAVASLKTRYSSIVAEIVLNEEPVIRLHSEYPDLESLKNFIVKDEASAYYIIVYDEPKMIFISYTPDATPIRSKMLYASSKMTFQRQIGANNLKSFMFTEPEDIDINSWTGTTAREDVMTQYELEKIQIDAQQHSMRSSGAVKLVSAQTNSVDGLGFRLQDQGNIKPLFDKHNFLVFKIDFDTEEVNIKNKINISSESDLIERIPSDSPSYSLFHKGDEFYFILSCPSGSIIKERMVYAANKRSFLNDLKSFDHITVKKTFEVGDSDELDVSEFSVADTDANPANQTRMKSKFNKPKAPSRRR